MNHLTFLRKGVSLLAFVILHLWQASAQDCNALPTFNFTLTNQTVNIATVYPIGSWIRITGTVNFNANVTMQRCTVFMDPGAVLNISNSTFTMIADAFGNRSVIFGCTSMWQAINVNQGGSVIFRNSLIRDGREGLVFNQGFNNTLCELSFNEFRLNSAGIAANGIANLTFATFVGNSFRGKVQAPIFGFLIPPLPPHGVNEPIYGIKLFGVTGTIGTAGAQNTFSRFTAGILAENNSNITINNCRFSTNTDPGWGGWGGGVGVWAINSTLTIQNLFSNAASCEFINNRRAVRSENTVGLTLKNARFDQQVVVDIEVVGSINPYNVDISNNIINIGVPLERSIFVERAAQGSLSGIHTRVQSNIITFPQPVLGTFLTGNRQIMEFRARAGALDQAVIANNQITCTYGNGNQTNAVARTIDGIWIQGFADCYQVSGNAINYVNPNGPPNATINSVAIGVVNNAGTNNIVGPNNTITTTRFNPFDVNGDGHVTDGEMNGREAWLRCGVHIDGSQNVAVCKNDADDPRHCYHFNGNCANGEWGRNKIRDGYFGLYMTAVTYPNQNYRMNEWILGSNYNARSASVTGVAGIPWSVDNTLSGHLAPQPTVPVGFQLIAPNQGTSGTPICDAVVPPPGGFGEPPTGVIAQKFLNNEYGLTNPAAAWDFERTLLYQMIRFPATYAGNSTAAMYYNEEINSSIWQFGKAERMLHEATAISAQNQQNLDQLHSSNKALADSLGTIEQWEGADTTSINPTWQTTKTNLLAQISANQGQIAALNTLIRSQHLSNLENVSTYVNDLPTSSTLESNYKTLLTLMVKQHLGESWTQQDSVSLRAIANLCPETDGEAVTIARGMLPAPESYSFGREDNDPACNQERGETGTPFKEKTGITLWPNPAADMLTVDFQQPLSGTLEIINSSGAVMQFITLNEATRGHIPTGRLANGLYFLRLLATGHPVQTLKFTVAH